MDLVAVDLVVQRHLRQQYQHAGVVSTAKQRVAMSTLGCVLLTSGHVLKGDAHD